MPTHDYDKVTVRISRRVKSLVITGLLILTLILGYFVVPVEAWNGTVYINADGSVDPPSAPIIRSGNLYTLTDNIHSSYRGIVISIGAIVVDGAGFTLQGVEGANISVGIELYRRSSVTIRNMQITGFDYGISILSSSNNEILGNNIVNNKQGAISFSHSSSNIISGNNIVNNGYWSVNLQDDSSSNSILGNNITNNDRYGIHLNNSPSNIVSGNDITGAEYGIYIEASSSFNSISENNIRNCKPCGIFVWASSNSNRIYHNNLLDNVVTSSGVVNVWDNAYPSGGNYWSDYKGTDVNSGPNQDIPGSDGIGDIPRIISANNTDRYPLMKPWTLTYTTTSTTSTATTTRTMTNSTSTKPISTTSTTSTTTATPSTTTQTSTVTASSSTTAQSSTTSRTSSVTRSTSQITTGDRLDFVLGSLPLIAGGAIAVVAVVILLLVRSYFTIHARWNEKIRKAQGNLEEMKNKLQSENYDDALRNLDSAIESIEDAVHSKGLMKEMFEELNFISESLKIIKERLLDIHREDVLNILVKGGDFTVYVSGIICVLGAFRNIDYWKKKMNKEWKDESEYDSQYCLPYISDNPLVSKFNEVNCNSNKTMKDFWFIWEPDDYEPIRLTFENERVIRALSRLHWKHITKDKPYVDKKNRIYVFFPPYIHTPRIRGSKEDVIFFILISCFNASAKRYDVIYDKAIDPYYTKEGEKPRHIPPVYYPGWPELGKGE